LKEGIMSWDGFTGRWQFVTGRLKEAWGRFIASDRLQAQGGLDTFLGKMRVARATNLARSSTRRGI
jgi:uncharacterized protein YjbJ (UPF0337 family)